MKKYLHAKLNEYQARVGSPNKSYKEVKEALKTGLNALSTAYDILRNAEEHGKKLTHSDIGELFSGIRELKHDIQTFWFKDDRQVKMKSKFIGMFYGLEKRLYNNMETCEYDKLR